MNLSTAERTLRTYDKAIRLRLSLVNSGLVLIERKTFRGRIGKTFRGTPYLPDQGYRAEHGHVHVASLPARLFETAAVRDALQYADTWRFDRPLWRRVDERDGTNLEYRDARRRARRQDMLRYKTGELWDRFTWATKARVSVPVKVT